VRIVAADAGRRLIAAAKCSSRVGETVSCLIKADGGISLHPVGTLPGAATAEEVRVLTEWRNRHVTAFLTQFEATPERTAAWLVSTVGPDPGRVVLIVREQSGAIFGHCGLASVDWATGTFELDGVTRGTKAAPGGMSVALRALLDWAIRQLGLSTPLVRVISRNTHALEFYSRLGFVETHRVPLRRVEEPGMVSWVPDPSGAADSLHLVHLRMRAGGPASDDPR